VELTLVDGSIVRVGLNSSMQCVAFASNTGSGDPPVPFKSVLGIICSHIADAR
jgi:hypothetical protein